MPGDRLASRSIRWSAYGGAENARGRGLAVSEIHLRYARTIANPGDRSLALSRIASAATFNNQLEMADAALTDASNAAMEMPDGLVRDQRLISIVMALLYLGEAHLREGRTDISIPRLPRPRRQTLPKVDRVEPDPPDDLATRHPPRRGSSPSGSATSTTTARELDVPGRRRPGVRQPVDRQRVLQGGRGRERGSGATATGARRGPTRSHAPFNGLPDQMLQEAAAIAERIDRPVWHDRGLVAVASAAAESRQFARALLVARRIPQPEVRTDALLKIAEIQARRGDPKNATATYREAAEAVASIPLADPRAVLAGVLIDNLIAVGRFVDARASIGLYPDQPPRLLALGSIAESQGAARGRRPARLSPGLDQPRGARADTARSSTAASATASSTRSRTTAAATSPTAANAEAADRRADAS